MKPDTHTPSPEDPVRAGIAGARAGWAGLIPRYRRREILLTLIDGELRTFGARRGGAGALVSTRRQGLVLIVSVFHRDAHSLDPVERPVLHVNVGGPSITVADGLPDGFSMGTSHGTWRDATREAARRLEEWILRGRRPPPRAAL